MSVMELPFSTMSLICCTVRTAAANTQVALERRFGRVVMESPLRGCLSLRVERKHPLPVALHARDDPAASLRFVETLVQPPDVRLAVIRPFALGIVVMDVET